MKLLFTLIASAALAGGALAADPVNEKCPLSGKPVESSVTADYKKEIHFCCEKCRAKFDKDPDSHVGKIADYDPKSGKCIFTGKDIDKEQDTTYERTVGFCCEKCPPKFEENPDKLTKKAVKKG